MPNMTLLPDGESSVSSDWITVGVGVSDPSEALQTNNGNTSYVKCNDDGESMIIEYANPSVAEADIASIDAVQFLSSGKAIHRTNPSLVDIAFQTPPGFSESCSYDAHRTNYESISGTVRTLTPAGGAWTYANLENLTMICTKDGSIEIYLSYLAMKVAYTEAVSADNATFFGANF